VHQLTGQLCVGTATVLPSAVARGAFTALLWFWTPPCPFHTATTLDDGLRYCLRMLDQNALALPRAEDEVRRGVTSLLRRLGDFGPSLGGAAAEQPD
jgi:hypothetical protein